jgi:hypothetical protein
METVIIQGKGTTPATQTKVEITNNVGQKLVTVIVRDDGSGLEVRTQDGQIIKKT